MPRVLTSAETRTASVYLGLRPGYDQARPPKSPLDVHGVVQAWSNATGVEVTVTPTTFVYRGDQEPGVVLGLVESPRRPLGPAEFRGRVLALAELVAERFRQTRVVVVIGSETVLLEDA